MGATRKVCRDCQIEKSLDAFPLQKGGRHGRHPLCKVCRAAQERRRYERDKDAILARRRSNAEARRRRMKWRALVRKYGLTRTAYVTLFVAQRGCCAICGLRPVRLFVDHCHATALVRGLLCSNCNFAVGELGDDPDRCLAAAAYLERMSVQPERAG